MSTLTPLNGISSRIRIEAEGHPLLEAEVRHFQLNHFIVERVAHDFLHNEAVTLHFNFVLAGKVNFVRLPARVKVDRHYGLRVEFERSSLLFEASRQLHNARRYTLPCNLLVEQYMSTGLARAV